MNEDYISTPNEVNTVPMYLKSELFSFEIFCYFNLFYDFNFKHSTSSPYEVINMGNYSFKKDVVFKLYIKGFAIFWYTPTFINSKVPCYRGLALTIDNFL